MRAVVERVKRAEVRVEGRVAGRIDEGLLVLVGIATGDTRECGQALAEKIVNLRLFEGEQGAEPIDQPGHPRGRMQRSLLEKGGSVLCVSQFTLYGDCRKGRRPSYDRAAPPEVARPFYEAFVESLRQLLGRSGARVETGQFQAMMEVELVNDGPVTLLLDSEKLF
ncbi:MAG: D-tyrosyl-tRNA(Tyr) deacylase [Acidobacteria bacterium]|nr:MAG: D-tyrosyl-tRNA(Tyr) deacylase [Acidobacteriota bacterium]